MTEKSGPGSLAFYFREGNRSEYLAAKPASKKRGKRK
jgi:hypothetical protein